jgi:Cu-Zn family superoxide dismutase
MFRRLGCAVVGAVVALMPIGCAHGGPGTPTATSPATSGPAPGAVLYGSGTLTAPNPASTAVTYNPALAPIGAAVMASLTPSHNSTVAMLAVHGLLPNRGYAVHAHTQACGATGEAAGPHYQNRVDPAATPQAPSTNPDYANPSNEIWLDVRTDATGSGTSHTTVPFTFTDRTPRSIVVHEAMTTAMGPGYAGQGGARLACLTLSGR